MGPFEGGASVARRGRLARASDVGVCFDDREMDLSSDDSLRRMVKTFAHLRAAHGAAIGAPSPRAADRRVLPRRVPARRRERGTALAADDGVRAALERAGHRTRGPRAPKRTTPAAEARPPAAPDAGGGGGAAGVDVHELENGYRVRGLGDGHGQPRRAVNVAGEVRRGPWCSTRRASSSAPRQARSPRRSAASASSLLNGSAVWAKSCGGLRMAQATILPAPETAVALALFVAPPWPQGLAGAEAPRGQTQRASLRRRPGLGGVQPDAGGGAAGATQSARVRGS